jgi:hypothetical protein
LEQADGKPNFLLRLLNLRKTAYQQTFNKESLAVKAVLKDLAKFCHANATTVTPSERLSAVLEGRREVFLRIQQHIYLTPEELLKLYE